MATELIVDRGRGPEIVGTRITVYNLLSHFLDPTLTEQEICQLYELRPLQVAAARAYVLNNADIILEKHLQIEERLAAGSAPEIIEQAKRVHERFLSFKQWQAMRELPEVKAADQPATDSSRSSSSQFPTFREWLSEQSSPTQVS